jgi:hypothetical protein
MTMKTDTVVRVEAMDTLIATLGMVDAERFISMVKRDTFDYTEWQRKHWDNMTIEENHALATELEKKNSAHQTGGGSNPRANIRRSWRDRPT